MEKEQFEVLLKRLDAIDRENSARHMAAARFALYAESLLDEILDQTIRLSGYSTGIEKVEIDLAVQRVVESARRKQAAYRSTLKVFRHAVAQQTTSETPGRVRDHDPSKSEAGDDVQSRAPVENPRPPTDPLAGPGR